jgi:hypothetical protein
MEAFVSPAAAAAAAQQLVSDLLGEMLAGREWRAVRDAKGAVPARSDFNFRTFGHRRRTSD